MSAIHHATRKRATKLGWTIEPLNDGYAIYDEHDRQIAWNEDPKVALDSAEGNHGSTQNGSDEVQVGPELPEESGAVDTVSEAQSEEGEETEESRETRSVVRHQYYETYRQFGGRCGDDIAEVLHSFLFPNDTFSEERFQQVVRDNDVDKDWNHLNIGMRRMNLSNVLRGKIRRGSDVVIGESVFGSTKEEAA